MRMRVLVVATVLGVGQVAAQSVRDSAGVRIVESTAPLRSGARAWRLDPTPVLDIGDGRDREHELAYITGVSRSPDGRVAVAAQSTNMTRLFDASGRYLGTVGGVGEGPGEVKQLLSVRFIAGDTLLVYGSGRPQYFTTAGKLIREAPRRGGPGGYPFPVAVFSDGSFAGYASARDYRLRPLPGRVTDSAAIVRVSAPGGTIDTIVRAVPMNERDGDNGVTFGPFIAMSGRGSELYLGYPSRYEIRAYSTSGKLLRVLRKPNVNRVVSQQTIAEYKEARRKTTVLMDGNTPVPLSAEARARIDATPFAERYSEFVALLADADGNVWSQNYNDSKRIMCGGMVCTPTYRAPSTWEVFDHEGRWLCTVAIPADFTPLDIGSDHVTGVWRDADDVEHVRVYRLIKP